jgi:hypothetical protein
VEEMMRRMRELEVELSARAVQRSTKRKAENLESPISPPSEKKAKKTTCA